MFYNLNESKNINNILNSDIKKIQDGCVDYVNNIPIPNIKYTHTNSGIILPRTFLEYDPTETKVSFGFHNDIYEYLYQQNMYIYLGVTPDKTNHFNCIMHDDTEHSATIFRHKDNGMYLYKCKVCGFRVGDINKVTECLTHLNRPDALQFMMNVYGITLDKTDEQIKQEKILDANIRFLMNRENILLNYPELYNRIKYYLPQLIILHEFAKLNLTLTQARNSSLITFTAPLKALSEDLIKQERNGDIKQISKRNNIFVFLTLLMKLPDSEVLPIQLQNLKDYSLSKGYYNYANVYSIDSYSHDTLSIAEDKAKEWKESGMTVRGFGREMIDKGFGDEKVIEVFPRIYNKPYDILNFEISKIVKRKIFSAMKSDGYIIEREIHTNGYFIRDIKKELDHFNQTPDVHVNKITKRMVQTVCKIYIPELVNSYDFKESRLTNILREKLNISTDKVKGSPTILYWDKQI